MFVNEPELTVPSAVPLWEGANWLEREVCDMFGIRFEGHPDLRRILMPEEFTAYPAAEGLSAARARRAAQFPGDAREPKVRHSRKDRQSHAADSTCHYAREDLRRRRASSDYLWTLNFGPQHPATHTTLRLVLKLDGERVVDAVPDIGYLHSGFEKLGEHLDYNQYVTVTDRMNYISPMANNVAWHQRGREAAGDRAARRAASTSARSSAELARISDHLLCNGARGARHRARSRSFCTPSISARMIYDIFETLCGAAVHATATRASAG